MYKTTNKEILEKISEGKLLNVQLEDELNDTT